MAADAILSVYIVLDDSHLRLRQFEAAASAAVEGGATLLQFRSRALKDAEKLSAITAIMEAVQGRGVPLVVNDRIDLALCSGAAGVHLGKEDVPIDMARRLLGPRAIIGGTAHAREEAVRAEAKGADYVSAGCIFPSSTKPGLTPAGTGLIEEVASAVRIPVVAIGGMTPERARLAVEAGAAGVASVSYVWESGDWRCAVAALAAAVREQKTRGGGRRPEGRG